MGSGPQEKPPPCPDCGGERVWANVDTSGGSSGVTVSVEGPKRFGFNTAYTRLTALVCTHCGYTRLYAQEPHKLRPEKS